MVEHVVLTSRSLQLGTLLNEPLQTNSLSIYLGYEIILSCVRSKNRISAAVELASFKALASQASSEPG